MADVYLGLGSNLGDRAAALEAAIEAIEALPGTMAVCRSPIYETPPMGPQDQGAYLNMAVGIRSSLQPEVLIASFQRIESQLGRPQLEERRRWGPRPIDIDVLMIGDQVINTALLTVPHPGLHERWFVLKPLADVAPDMVHPTLGRSILELLTTIENTSKPQEAAT